MWYIHKEEAKQCTAVPTQEGWYSLASYYLSLHHFMIWADLKRQVDMISKHQSRSSLCLLLLCLLSSWLSFRLEGEAHRVYRKVDASHKTEVVRELWLCPAPFKGWFEETWHPNKSVTSINWNLIETKSPVTVKTSSCTSLLLQPIIQISICLKYCTGACKRTKADAFFSVVSAENPGRATFKHDYFQMTSCTCWTPQWKVNKE